MDDLDRTESNIDDLTQERNHIAELMTEIFTHAKVVRSARRDQSYNTLDICSTAILLSILAMEGATSRQRGGHMYALCLNIEDLCSALIVIKDER